MPRRGLFCAAAILSVASLWCLAGPAPAPAGGEKIEVKHRLPAGSYVMTMTSQFDTVVTIAGKDEKSKSSETMVWSLKVGQPDAKGQKKAKLRVVKVKIVGEGTEPSYDSEGPADKQDAGLAYVYKPLMETDVVIQLDADDAVVEVSGLDKLWTGLEAKATTDDQKGAVAEVRIAMSDKAIELDLRRQESVIPRKAVASGDSWQAGLRLDLPVVGEIKARYDCKLQSVEKSPAGQVAVLGLEAKYESTNAKPAKISGVQVTMTKIEVADKATMKIDVPTGLVRSEEKTVQVNAEFKVTGEDGKEISVTTKGTATGKTTIEPGEAGKTKTPASGPLVVPGLDGAGGAK